MLYNEPYSSVYKGVIMSAIDTIKDRWDSMSDESRTKVVIAAIAITGSLYISAKLIYKVGMIKGGLNLASILDEALADDPETVNKVVLAINNCEKVWF